MEWVSRRVDVYLTRHVFFPNYKTTHFQKIYSQATLSPFDVFGTSWSSNLGNPAFSANLSISLRQSLGFKWKSTLPLLRANVEFADQSHNFWRFSLSTTTNDLEQVMKSCYLQKTKQIRYSAYEVWSQYILFIIQLVPMNDPQVSKEVQRNKWIRAYYLEVSINFSNGLQIFLQFLH